MIRVNHMTRCVAAACSALAGAAFVPAALAQAPAQQPQQLDRVEITGSAIRRTQQEGPAPVEIITRKEIERTGATTVNELIRSIASIDIFDQGELANNSPAGSGTANVLLRGLAETDLLVLLNGRRLPVNAIYDSSGAGAAVDINMIPISAIERIEILKDGGSAIYGADAVAGVINFITKRDYQGIEARAGYGQSSRNDGKETAFGIAGGFGDLNSQRFNVFGALDYFKRDPIYRKDREISRSVDFRRFGGGDNRSTFAPQGNWASSTTFGTLSPYTPCAPADQDTAGRCRYDFNASILSAYNGADRLNLLTAANFLVTKDIRAFAEVVYSKSEDQFISHPAPDFFLIPPAAFAPNAILPPPAASEATSLGAPGFFLVGGRFLQAGNRTTDRESTLLQTTAGMDGTSFNIDWKFNIGRGVSEVTNSDSNYLDANAVFNAISAGQINPTVTTNNQALVDSLKVRPVRKGKSTLDLASGQLSGDAFNLPAGPLRYAAGLSWLKEELTDTPDPLTQAGAVLGSIQQAAVQASRTTKAFFAELSIPVTRSIEAQLAGRYDDYPRETASSLKAAVKYQPVSNLLLRASYTESFRAPSLKQLFGAQEEGAINITDDDLCLLLGATPPCNISAFQVNGSNPDLKSETGETVNIGIVFDVGSAFAASLDFWRIAKKDSISSPTIATAIQQGRFNTSGGRLRVFTNLQNIAEVANSGFDLDLKFRAPGTPIGNITIRDLFSYYYHQKTRSSSADDWAEFIDTYALPRYRNVLSVLAEKGPWSTQFSLRTVAGFYDTDRAWPLVTQRKVGSHEELDAQVSYSGWKDLTLTGGIKNLLDNMPPFSAQNANSNAYTQMGFAELYSSRGAFYYMNLRYKFR
jgi:iron complex outermembrane receptor protein